VPYDQQTSASRSTVLMGNAILLACRDIKARLEDRLGTDYDASLPATAQVKAALGVQGGEIIGTAEARKTAEPDHPLGGSALFYEFNATAVELSVDEQTGDITIHRHVAVSDVGRSINRLQVQMQDEGAAIMGLGHTLMEHYIFDDTGRIRNLGAIDYRIPTSMDLPQEMLSDTIENGDGPGPYGAKGMSEGALLPVSSAVAAAVRDATGVAIRDLPLSPERVWRALQERDRA
jgi:CO/xanthine dehydrogenase Mo-binding subunit